MKGSGLALAVSLAIGRAGAALHDRGGGMIYHDVLDITWLSDANFANTSTYATPDGREVKDVFDRMTWDEAREWVANLVHGGVGSWRLPRVVDAGLPPAVRSVVLHIGANW